MPLLVNIVVPIIFSLLIIGCAGIVNQYIKSKLSAFGLAIASLMAIPFIISAIFQKTIIFGGIVFLGAALSLYYYHFCKKGKASDLLSIFAKEDLFYLGIIAIFVIGIFLPGILGDGYFIPNPNFDFIFQSVDARYMSMHDPTVFDLPINKIPKDLPLDWSANHQGRYLSSVVQALIAKIFFNGNILEGSVSAFVYFYLILVASLYVFFSAFLDNKRNVMLATLLALASVYGWAPIHYMLIGQLSSVSIFLLLIGGFAKLLSKNKPPPFKSILPLAVTLGFLCIAYFALGFFAICIIGLLYLKSDIGILAKHKVKPIMLPLALCAGVYFLPYLSKPQVIIEIINSWFEVIFSKMNSPGSGDEVAVEFLSELISLRLLGFDLNQLRIVNNSLVNPLSGLYVITCLVTWLGFGYITILLILKNYKDDIFIRVTWLTMSGFAFIFFLTQSGYLVFKTLSYLFFVPPLIYFALLESKNLGSIHKRIVSIVTIALGCMSFTYTLALNKEVLSENPGAKFGTGVGMNPEYVHLIKYIRSNLSGQKIWLALPTPNQQGYVLLGAGNFQDSGIGQNSQVLENARWEDTACDVPKISSADLLIIPSRFAMPTDAASKAQYTNPIFENREYAITNFKDVHRLIIFSRGFYPPEPVKLTWNNSYELSRWSSGRSAILVYSDEPTHFINGRILTYDDLILSSSSIKSGNVFLKGMPVFQDLTFSLTGKGWQCVEIVGDASFKKPPLNRWIFKSRPADPRPIKYLIGGVNTW